MSTTFTPNQVIGLSEADAVKEISAAGLTPRIMERNGDFFVVTYDFDTHRVNLWIASNTVYKVSLG